MKRYLVLENGDVFEGEAFGASGEVISEIVFTTAMTGYLETLTDKSYKGQAVVQGEKRTRLGQGRKPVFERHVADAALSVGRAVDGVVVHHDDHAVLRLVEVGLDPVGTELDRVDEGGHCVFGAAVLVAAVGGHNNPALFYRFLESVHFNLHSAAKASAQIEMKAGGKRHFVTNLLYTVCEERHTTTHGRRSRRCASC